MRKKLPLCLLAAFIFLSLFSPLFSQEADIVVLMDTSGTILPWFDQIYSSVLPDIAGKFIRQGDMFHLISFNSRANLELVQPVETQSDISRIVSRVMLLYPLGRNSDFLSGLNFTWQYLSGLDRQREKIVIVISDGIFNPPDSSPYASFTLRQVQEEVNQYAARMREAGWQVYCITLPYSADIAVLPLDGSAITERITDESSQQIAATSGTEQAARSGSAAERGVSATESVPAATGRAYGTENAATAEGSLSGTVNTSTAERGISGAGSIPAVESASSVGRASATEGVSPAERGVSSTGDVPTETGRASGTENAPAAIGRASGTENASAVEGSVSGAGGASGTDESFFRSNGFILPAIFLIILALVILIAVIAFVSRRTAKPVAEINKAAGAENSAGRRQAVFAEYTRKKASAVGAVPLAREAGFEAAKAGEAFYISDSYGKVTLNLYVERQNSRIGRRNVHQMKAGSRLSIGGGASSFLVFLVKFPANLAEIRYDGRRCSLAILKPEFFPYEKSSIIEDCLERPVTIVSDKGYPVTFMLRQFEDPVVTLNRLLNSINED